MSFHPLYPLGSMNSDMKILYQGFSEFVEMKELMPLVVNKLIERIETHNLFYNLHTLFYNLDFFKTKYFNPESRLKFRVIRQTGGCKKTALIKNRLQEIQKVYAPTSKA